MLRATSFLSARSAPQLLLAVTISNFALPPAAKACSCGHPKFSVAEQFELADAVFYGEVLSRRLEGNCDFTSDYFECRAAYTFRVIQSWKGVTGKLVGLITAENGAACGSDFEVGELRLVYAVEDGCDCCFILCAPGVLVSHLCLRCSDRLLSACIPTEDIEEIENLGHEPLSLTSGADPLFPPLPALDQWSLVLNRFYEVDDATLLQQGVTVGTGGKLVRIDLSANDAPFPGSFFLFSVNLGSPWQTDANDFEATIPWPDDIGWFSIDVSAANLSLQPQDTFVIGIQGIAGSNNAFTGSEVEASGYSGGELWQDGVLLSEGQADLAFQTFVEVQPIPAVGGFGLLIIAASMLAAGAWIMRKRSVIAA